jgi:hypothetical protein
MHAARSIASMHAARSIASMHAARTIACPPHHTSNQTLVGLAEMTGVEDSQLGLVKAVHRGSRPYDFGIFMASRMGVGRLEDRN